MQSFSVALYGKTPVRRIGPGGEAVWPRTTAACACSRAAIRASGVFATGTGTTTRADEGARCREGPAIGCEATFTGGDIAALVFGPKAFSIQLFMCASLSPSELGKALEGSSRWQT